MLMSNPIKLNGNHYILFREKFIFINPTSRGNIAVNTFCALLEFLWVCNERVCLRPTCVHFPRFSLM